MGKSERSYADRRAPEEFWEMTADEFNAWRKQEDFPRILDFFRTQLNGFTDWQNEYGIDNDYLIEEGISEFFVAEDYFVILPKGKLKYYIEVSTSDKKKLAYVTTTPLNVGETYQGGISDTQTITRCIEFEPFTQWAHVRKIKPHTRAHNGQLRVTTIEAVESPEYCRTFLLGDLELIKLGGLKSKFGPSLGGRMLQFVNLDFLKFQDIRFDAGIRKRISFASARHWEITNSELHF